MLVLNCLIVEDEALAARVIADYVGQMPGLSLKGVCEDVFTAMKVLNEEQVDVIFLDINLPKVSGIEFIKTINQKYHIVLTTAYHQYAIEGFNLDVIDYLLKPVSFERFIKAANKVRDYHELMLKQQETAVAAPGYLFVKTDNRLEKIHFDDILYIEAQQNYIIIRTEAKKILTYSSLKNVESYLPAGQFLKVQKSFIVAIDKIDRIEGSQVVVGNTAITISRSNKDEILELILTNRLLKK